MDMLEVMRARHAVRDYTDAPIEGEVLARLREEIAACNDEGGLSIQLCLDNPEAFAGGISFYGLFHGVRHVVALVGPEGPGLDEACGYFGERIALAAQGLGLNTCWVALSYKRRRLAAKIGPGEKCACVLAIGYGVTSGKAHKVKPLEALCRVDGKPAAVGGLPEWFRSGIEAAQLAPTAVNQQKFLFDLLPENRVAARALCGPYTAVDLGIAKYHFEVGANLVSPDWRWDAGSQPAWKHR